MVLPMTSGYGLDLPNDIQLQYLAEGGANIVYRIALPPIFNVPPSEIEYYGDITPPPTEIEDSLEARLFRRNLVRLRKDVQFGFPYRDTANNFNTKIRHLFRPEELVDQILVRLPPDLTARCNEQLRASERTGKRPTKRHGVYLAPNEPFGMLITDMTNFADPAATVVAELKPKWLVQSPSAPAGARRCRTCALRDMKNSNTDGGKPAQPPQLLELSRSFCPLDLISEKIEDIQRVTRIFKGRSDQIRIAKALCRHPTLLNLVSLQQAHNDVGLRGPPVHSREMSLDPPEDGPIELRLGDLDLKTAASGKASYWRSIENRLILEGWYMGENPSQVQTSGECALSRIRM
ncbi:inositol-pentakisphosphate 2-kinase-domain-containing protein [Talaromyces proteolyticus]|uniref:Inositol-pentakisphosphate 2-kinase n=1 Tax=Talaromyces proteolyticus TaxID=1131652 RepID=A0AAD4L263_9EURO|nr:inositol-pentakisphosphate 2-kinase-domain-containing protein [Talaromyces proteolyticus]KAH8704175.1 inositol-pentakisphosphate 2-kinase-domain-containing protein [Talaromyces proteolyticus]